MTKLPWKVPEFTEVSVKTISPPASPGEETCTVAVSIPPETLRSRSLRLTMAVEEALYAGLSKDIEPTVEPEVSPVTTRA